MGGPGESPGGGYLPERLEKKGGLWTTFCASPSLCRRCLISLSSAKRPAVKVISAHRGIKNLSSYMSRENQDISDIFNQAEQIACFYSHLLFTFRPLSGVKLRLERGGEGSWTRGRARGGGPKLGPSSWARRPKETSYWKVSSRRVTACPTERDTPLIALS